MIVNENKLKRQKEVVKKWIDNKYKGLLQAVTGFGKSYTAILIIQYIRQLRPDSNIYVVVPTIYLQEQWEKELLNNNLLNINVLVINTASKLKVNCDLLILDEIHLYGSEQFSKVFESISYKSIFGLTATLERSDGKEELIKEYCPLIDNISIQEALDNNYVSKYIIYNIPVELSKIEKQTYIKLLNTYGYYEHLLGGKFTAWTKANEILKDNSNNTQEDIKSAVGFLRTVNKRKTFLYNIQGKIQLAIDIANKFNKEKIVVFSETISFAEQICNKINNSTIYHSNLKAKEKKANIFKFINDIDCNLLSSVKALDTGMDIPNISIGITCAGTSKSLQALQRLGRTIRFQEGKIAKFFNIYLKDSQEEKWLKQKYYNIPEVYWIENLNEIKYVF